MHAGRKKGSRKPDKLILPGPQAPERKHFCPECGEQAKIVVVMPKRTKEILCQNGHRFPKREAVLKAA